ncbi:Glycosyl hydrolases family 28 [Musa troglodytarum]|uniref:Glycosyl hydrolases family 28 n=1 Tax=Musa troglodytarum TaxID=320322 RepID=A0A9E7EDV5_9LILI|nr:Glycosyl hydrolases family 28 [Musa troglodytarum]
MRDFRLKCFGLILLVILVMCSKFDGCEGRKGRRWRKQKSPYSSAGGKKGKNGGGHNHGSVGGDYLSPALRSNPITEYPMKTAMFNVLDFRAKGDGITDDTEAFQAAWADACKVEGSTVVVPAKFEFLVGPISFSGPYCQPNIALQKQLVTILASRFRHDPLNSFLQRKGLTKFTSRLDGMIIAPTDAKRWGSGLLWWIEFSKLQGISIRGSGTIEGQGSVWWTTTKSDVDPINAELSMKLPQIKPALRFYGSYNVTVTGITIQNSPQCHLKFDNCEAVQVFNMTINSPGSSLNTDGIHLQNSRDVMIHHTNMSCSDDCVSIQTGCSNINIHSVECGPGHGISIGGLGRDNTKACVSNITVRDVNMHNTMTGVRIKTWQGGSGSVESIKFSNIRVSEVQTPIVIDQFYCDRSSCKNQTSAVVLSGIAYENMKGTYTVKPVHFACSDTSPCSDISPNRG